MNQARDGGVLPAMRGADPTLNDDDDGAADESADAGFDASRLYLPAAAAFCRGRLGVGGSDEDAVVAGRAAGLRLHRFKRATVLPRVERTLSTLKGLAPSSLLDLGTGRGVFLWPLLDALPWLPVTCVDLRDDRVADLDAVSDEWDFAAWRHSGARAHALAEAHAAQRARAVVSRALGALRKLLPGRARVKPGSGEGDDAL